MKEKKARLPRKLKKDIIKVVGRENYYKIIRVLRIRLLIGGGLFGTKIRKIKVRRAHG